MHLLRAYCGDEIREMELTPGKAYSVGGGQKCDLVLESFQSQKKPLTVAVEDNGWRLEGLKKGPNETWQLAEKLIPFEKVCVLDEEADLALAVYRSGPDTSRAIDLSNVKEVVIGRSSRCDITVDCRQISGQHLRLYRSSDSWEFEDLKSANGTYLDGRLSARGSLTQDDELTLGFARLRLVGDQLTVSYDGTVNSGIRKPEQPKTAASMEDPYPYFFCQSPRLQEELPLEMVELQSPPNIGGKPTINWLDVLLMPLLTVAIMVAVCVFATGIMTTLFFSVPMTLVGLVMSVIRYRRQKNTYQKNEQARLEKYSQYIEEQEAHLVHLESEQRRILSAQNPSTVTCVKISEGPARTLWDRKRRDTDFMTLRVGSGSLPAVFSIRAPRQMLSLEQDQLALRANELEERYQEVQGCPITMDLGTYPTCGVIGNRSKCVELGRNLLVQATAHLSYDDLRVVLIFDREEREKWAFARWLPHIYDDARQQRYIVDSPVQAAKILSQLDDLLSQRILENEKTEYGETPLHRPFYLFLCASYELMVSSPVMKKIAASDPDLGVAAVFLFDRLERLPKDCHYVVELTQKNVLYEKERASAKQQFVLDHIQPEQYEQYARGLAPIRVELTGGGGTLPTNVSFLQGMKAQMPQSLHVEQRWQSPRPEKSMAVPIGQRADGMPFLFDIHEKHHGPHGLVAGMTGSGKSEMVQSWILSMAVNFPPSAVSFVLIDFKGTGLLLPFKNLPHLAGTVSDLDTSIGRNLIALENELTRRKTLLDQYQVSNISGYLKLYHEGKAEKPLPYLFIVIDEFAEFKLRFPDFMQAVNSVFAIGRTLGVHMILLTQKPASVVDDKMNANTRFRWCLKVANSADSRDMLHHPDAAKITNPGRAFVQVGEDEVFEEIQSFWSGAPYNPCRDLTMQRSTKVSVVDLYGQRVSYEPDKTTGYRAEKSEIEAVVEYLDDYCRRSGTERAKAIWTSKLPEELFLRDLTQVGFDGESWSEPEPGLRPAVGLLDDPRSQSQYPFYLNLTEEGHIAVYGAPGSGKTTLIHTLIISAALSYTPDELHMYMMDFGGGSLNLFRELPHVGGVALGDDDERINKLAQMLLDELERRKKRIAELGLVSIQSYKEATGEPLPFILLLLDNFAPVLDMYPDLDTFFQTLVRDCASCGIYLVATANTQSALSYRISQNIKFSIALRMPDKSDYAPIVGSTGGLLPENHPGRGLVCGAPPLEVQFALPAEGAREIDRVQNIRSLSRLMRQKWRGEPAKPIPVLPEAVHPADYPTSELLVGLSCKDVSLCTLDPAVSPFLLVSCAVDGTKHVQALFSQLREKLAPEVELGYAPECTEAFDEAIASLMPVLQDRKNRAQEQALSAETDRPILILIPDIQSCFEGVSNDTARRLASIVSLGDGLHVLVAAAGDAQQISKLYHGGEQFTMRMVQKAAAVLIGGNAAGHNVFSTDLSYSEANAQLNPGEGYLIRERKTVKIKVVE